jgi:transposase InsO family protein
MEQNSFTLSPAPPYTPQFNGVAERFNRTVVSTARALLIDANLPKSFWAEAVNFATYLNNRMPSRGQQQRDPFQAVVWSSPPTRPYSSLWCALPYNR